MKIAADKLAAQLARSLAPIYVVYGEEPLLVAEAATEIRAQARARGHAERELHYVERSFDWDRLVQGSANLSLFTERRLIELRLTSASPGEAGTAALLDYAEHPADDTVLLVVCPHLDRKAAGARWVLGLEAAGVLVQVRNVPAGELEAWIGRRMRAQGLVPTPAAAQLLAARVEGNLLAATQEIEKLRLLHGPGAIDDAAVRAGVADSARFDVFQLAEAALLGDGARALHVLEGLRAEGVEPPLVLWALTRDLRLVAALAWEKEKRGRSDVTRGIWPQRRSDFEAAARRRRLRGWHALLVRAGQVDQIAKGRRPGQPWEALAGLVAGFAGVRLA